MDSSEQQTKFIQERINSTEKNFENLQSAVLSLMRQQARVRDKQDNLAKIFYDYGQTEAFNLTLAEALSSLAKSTTFLADINDLEIKRLSAKVATELSQYESICKKTRESIKESISIRDRELSKNKRVGKKPEAEIIKSQLETTNILHEIERQIESFEQRKLKDLKEILQDFVLIQLKMHSGAVEVLTSAYQDITTISEKADLEEIKKHLSRKDNTRLGRLHRFRSRSMGTITSLFTSGSEKRKLEDNKKRLQPQTSKLLAVEEKLNEINDLTDASEEDDEDESSDEESTESDDEHSRKELYDQIQMLKVPPIEQYSLLKSSPDMRIKPPPKQQIEETIRNQVKVQAKRVVKGQIHFQDEQLEDDDSWQFIKEQPKLGMVRHEQNQFVKEQPKQFMQHSQSQNELPRKVEQNSRTTKNQPMIQDYQKQFDWESPKKIFREDPKIFRDQLKQDKFSLEQNKKRITQEEPKQFNEEPTRFGSSQFLWDSPKRTLKEEQKKPILNEKSKQQDQKIKEEKPFFNERKRQSDKNKLLCYPPKQQIEQVKQPKQLILDELKINEKQRQQIKNDEYTKFQKDQQVIKQNEVVSGARQQPTPRPRNLAVNNQANQSPMKFKPDQKVHQPKILLVKEASRLPDFKPKL